MTGAETIWLVGMMGAGKSSVGRLLAGRLGVPFVDADEEIERAAGGAVGEIFAREGEAGFRARERAAVQSLLGRGAVVALGGGALTSPEVRAAVNDEGVLVYLRASWDTLLARLGDCESRPLLADLVAGARGPRLRALLAERRAAYEAAAVIVDTDALTPEAAAEAVAAALRAGRGPA